MAKNLNEIAKIVTQETCRVLKDVLPAIGGPKWWNACVVAKLSYQQQERVQRNQLTSLEKLDLAALIRIVDKNWFEIAERASFPPEARTLVREVQNIRNRLAHDTAADTPLEDHYRDLDTSLRYLQLLKAPEEILNAVESWRKEVLQEMATAEESIPPAGKNQGAPPDPRAGSSDASGKSSRDQTGKASPAAAGVPLEVLGRGASQIEEVRKVLAEKTFIGIDFGTSTTTASRVVIDDQSGALSTEPIAIKQYDADGICVEDHLVPTCVAWTGKQLLVGQGAARLKSEFEYGRNIWFSFKMKLGMDLGPQYYRSELGRAKGGPCVIEKPQHAAAAFFQYLREQMESFVRDQKLPKDIVYSVSVPAAFEANQRQDLCAALSEAGISVPQHGIIDEPNAAFISYLLETFQTGTGIAKSMQERKRNVLVFDFGAGTCDISILEVSATNKRFVSRNRAISQFHALGGDNIDRQVVRELLWPQMFEQSKPSADFTSQEIDVAIIPRLQQAAEDMKTQCCKYISSKWDGRNLQPLLSSDMKVFGKPIPSFKVRGCELRLDKPVISLVGFAKVMRPFVDPVMMQRGIVYREDDVTSIFEPIDSAIRKAEIQPDQLDMVLFIGGSSLNPFVQTAIHERFGRFVECVLPGDLRTPVSRGTAVHAFVVNGLAYELIRPITSETIYVVTAGGGLHQVLPAGTEMPSGDIFVGDLQVQRDGQEKVELPMCVSSEDKVLGTIEVEAAQGRPFKEGETVTLACRLDENKLLHVKAKVGKQMVQGSLLNPLANDELTPAESRMLIARQAVNLSALQGNGRPDVSVMLHYAYACEEAEHWLESAEALEAVERLDMNRDFATKICYCYSKAGKRRLSDKWAEISYKRGRQPVAAFNLALTKRAQGDTADYERLMEEAIRMAPGFAAALENYGHYLKEKGAPKGMGMIDMAFEQMHESFEKETLDEDDLGRLRRAASTVGRKDVVEKVDRRRKDLEKLEKPYAEGNLAVSKHSSQTQKGSH